MILWYKGPNLGWNGFVEKELSGQKRFTENVVTELKQESVASNLVTKGF